MTRLQCVICKKNNISLFRINAKGVPGLWACRKHLKQTDAPAIDSVVDTIVSAVESGKP